MAVKSKIFLLFFVLILLAGCQLQSTMITKEISINNSVIQAEVARTPKEAAKGLSGRKELCSGCGLLFEYPDYRVMNYWMRDMNFALDVIWIRDDLVAGFEENVPVLDSEGQITRMQSKSEVNRVLEVNSGFVARNGIKEGDRILGLD